MIEHGPGIQKVPGSILSMSSFKGSQVEGAVKDHCLMRPWKAIEVTVLTLGSDLV